MKKTISIIAAVAVVAICAVFAYVFVFKDDKIAVATNDTNASVEPSAQENEVLEKSRESLPNKEKAIADLEKMTAFEDAEAVANFTKEDVQETLRLSADYANNSLTNVYFLGGHWVNDGMPNIIDDVSGRFFTADIREKIKAWDTNPETGENIGTNVMPLVFYVYPNGNITANDACNYSDEVKPEGESSEMTTSISCPVDGIKFSEMKYEPTMTDNVPGVKVIFSATAKVPVTIDGSKDGYSEVRYDYELNFIFNEGYEETTNPNQFVINWYEVKVNMGAVVEL